MHFYELGDAHYAVNLAADTDTWSNLHVLVSFVAAIKYHDRRQLKEEFTLAYGSRGLGV